MRKFGFILISALLTGACTLGQAGVAPVKKDFSVQL